MRAIPALLTRISSRPNAPSAAATNSFHEPLIADIVLEAECVFAAAGACPYLIDHDVRENDLGPSSAMIRAVAKPMPLGKPIR